MRAYTLLLALLCTLGACATTAAQMDLVRNRATFDLDCPKEKLEVVDLGNQAYGVRGCEKRASYLVVDCAPHQNADSCRVVLNSDEKSENAAGSDEKKSSNSVSSSDEKKTSESVESSKKETSKEGVDANETNPSDVSK